MANPRWSWHCRALTGSHANKGWKHYRYHVTHAEAVVGEAEPAKRVSAHDLERIDLARLQSFLADASAIHAAVAQQIVDARRIEDVIAEVREAAVVLGDNVACDRAAIVQRYVERVTLDTVGVEILVGRASLIGLDDQTAPDGNPVVLHAATVRVRRGHNNRLIVPSAKPLRSPSSRGRL